MIRVIKRVDKLYETVAETDKEVIAFNATVVITQSLGADKPITEVEIADGHYNIYDRGNRVTIHRIKV